MLQSGNNGKCLELAFLPLIIISIKTKNQRSWFPSPPPPPPPQRELVMFSLFISMHTFYASRSMNRKQSNIKSVQEDSPNSMDQKERRKGGESSSDLYGSLQHQSLLSFKTVGLCVTSQMCN